MKKFAWIPTRVSVWASNYREHTWVWLRYYHVVENKNRYEALDGTMAPEGLKYIVHKSRIWFLE